MDTRNIDLTERQKAEHQANLLRWQLMYQQPLHSDKIAAEIGIFTIKVVLTLNGAALAALLTALSQLQNRPSAVDVIQLPAKLFFFGLMAAALAAGLSYFYSSFVTARDWHTFYEAYPQPGAKPPYAWANRLAIAFIIFVIVLVVLSYVAFGWAAWNLIEVIPGIFKTPGTS